jgi:hypothetical protein
MTPGKEALDGDEYDRFGARFGTGFGVVPYMGDGAMFPKDKFPSKTNWLRL